MSELLDRALQAIRVHREGALKRGIELIGVVGSTARGDETPDSDIDIAYDVVGRASLLALSRAMLDLEKDLSRKVDLVDLSRVSATARSSFDRDLVRA